MFVSASVGLQVHTSSDDGLQNHQVQTPASGSKIISVSICNDNSYIALLRENEKPQIFSAKDLENVRLVHTMNVSNVGALVFRRNTKKNIALGTKTGDVVIYDTKTRTVASTYSKVTETVAALDFTYDDQQLCGLDGSILFVFPDINNGKDVKKYKQGCECTFLKCHPFMASRVAIGCRNGHVKVWDVQNGAEMVNLGILSSPVSGLVMSSCGKFLVVSGKELKLCGVDYETGCSKFLRTIDQERPVTSLDLSPDDKLLAVGMNDGTLKVYDVRQQMKLIYCGKLHSSAIERIVFENKSKEMNSNFSSVMKLASEIEMKPHEVESTRTRSTKSGKVFDCKYDDLQKMKRNLMKMIKTEMDCLERQLEEHCDKHQKFLDNEFDTIDGLIRNKWDVFNGGDINQILKGLCQNGGKKAGN